MKAPVLVTVSALGGVLAGYGLSFINNPAGNGSSASPSSIAETQRSLRQGNNSDSSGSAFGAKGSISRGKNFQSLTDILAEPGQIGRFQNMIDYYDKLGANQFSDEVRKLETMPMGVERMVAGFLLFAKWGESQPTEALAETNKLGFAGMFVRPTVLQSWAGKDPENAAAYYAENKSQFAMMGMMGGGRGGQFTPAATIASEWARNDPQKAMQWANSLSGQEKSSATSAVIQQMAQSDPNQAAQSIASMPAGSDKDAAISTLARQWGSKDWDKTQSWLASLPAEQQDAARQEAIAGLAGSNPSQAASEALKLPAGEQRDELIVDVAGQLSRQNPQEAMQYITQNASAESQRDGVREVMGNYARSNPQEARNYLQKLPEGEVRDSAAASYVMTTPDNNHQETIKVAENIGNERERERSIGAAAVKWYMDDKDAASSWIKSTPSLSEDTRTRYLQMAENGRMPRGGRNRR